MSETATLVEKIVGVTIQLIMMQSAPVSSDCLLDTGAGSGIICIAIALAPIQRTIVFYGAKSIIMRSPDIGKTQDM